ncbi:SUN domain-containing protein 3-like isoform X1 [Struthio camelus]|uniref:SUN domain-containing protein 3-like isoform X1 n=1 Tax=Struthio camelus TaxID=8801 RepID=UPI003603D1F2
MGAAKEALLHSVEEVLEESEMAEEKRGPLLDLTRAALEKTAANYLEMVDWALKTTGATIDTERTSSTYGGRGGGARWLGLWFFSVANPPDTILQPHTSPGQCWAFQGAEGQVVIRLPEHIWPRAVTVEHISKAVSPSGQVSSAPKAFAVSVSLSALHLRGRGGRGGNLAMAESCKGDSLLLAAWWLVAAEQRVPAWGLWGPTVPLCHSGLLCASWPKGLGALAQHSLTHSHTHLLQTAARGAGQEAGIPDWDAAGAFP